MRVEISKNYKMMITGGWTECALAVDYRIQFSCHEKNRRLEHSTLILESMLPGHHDAQT